MASVLQLFLAGVIGFCLGVLAWSLPALVGYRKNKQQLANLTGSGVVIPTLGRTPPPPRPVAVPQEKIPTQTTGSKRGRPPASQPGMKTPSRATVTEEEVDPWAGIVTPRPPKKGKWIELH